MREWDQGRPLGYAIWVETWKMEAAVKEMRFIEKDLGTRPPSYESSSTVYQRYGVGRSPDLSVPQLPHL